MAWYCLACRTEIRQNSLFDDLAEHGRPYKCHACRLELVFELPSGIVRVAPLDTERHKTRMRWFRHAAISRH